MTLNIRKALKGSLISLAVLGMIGGSLNIPNVNARRHYRTHRVYRHRAKRRVTYKFGYWKHHRYYRYKTGYFRNGRWVRKATRRRTRRIKRSKRTSRKVYRLHGRTYRNEREYDIALYNMAVFGNPNGPVKRHVRRHFTHRTKRHMANRTRRRTVKHTSTAPTTNQDNDDTVNNINNQGQTNNTQSQPNKSNANDPSVIATNVNEFKQQTLTDINNDRQANGLAPLTVSPDLENLANTRAQQIITNFAHTNTGYYGENLAETRSGKTFLSDGTPITNNNGYDMANNVENNLMNHDTASNNGHRDNILHSDSTQIGIGVSYNNSPSDYFPYKLAEDFR